MANIFVGKSVQQIVGAFGQFGSPFLRAKVGVQNTKITIKGLLLYCFPRGRLKKVTKIGIGIVTNHEHQRNDDFSILRTVCSTSDIPKRI